MPFWKVFPHEKEPNLHPEIIWLILKKMEIEIKEVKKKESLRFSCSRTISLFYLFRKYSKSKSLVSDLHVFGNKLKNSIKVTSLSKMSNKISTIAKNIRKYRKQKGLSQDKLSRLADISHATMIKIESGGIQSPTIDTVQKIAKALGVSVDNLLNGK